MESRENIKQKKSTRSNEVFGVMERVYSREQYVEKGRGLKKYKESSSRIWKETKYKSKKAGKMLDVVYILFSKI